LYLFFSLLKPFSSVTLQLQLENFNFKFVFDYSFLYASTSLIPDFITDSKLTCAWKTGLRPPCWKTDGTKQGNCFVDQFDWRCIARGTPATECGALGPIYQTIFGNKLGDVCCRDAIANGVSLPTLSTLCYDTQQERTGSYVQNRASCPANLIERGYDQSLLSWRLL
jgi:hypothetical protein